MSCGYGTTHFYKKSMPEIWSFGLNSLGQLGSKDHANSLFILFSNLFYAGMIIIT